MSVLESMTTNNEKYVYKPDAFLKTKNNMYHIYPHYNDLTFILKKKSFKEMEALKVLQ